MIFKSLPLDQLSGCYLAHSTKIGGRTFKKGHLISQTDVTLFETHGVVELIAAKLDKNEVHEQIAAERVANSVLGKNLRADPPFTGRVNLYAEKPGLLKIDVDGVNRLNQLHPAITLATLPNFERVEEGAMVATVKIIPFAAPLNAVKEAQKLKNLLEVRAFRPMRVVLIATRLNSLKPSVMDKTVAVLNDRLAKAGTRIHREYRVEHNEKAIADALKNAMEEIADIILIFGASANVDTADIGPAGLELAGGTLHHFGMPVDPGNLLYMGAFNGIPIIGAPGCARSSAENGFDWVLERLLAGLEVTRQDIAMMGVGGLLKEIRSRPQLREAPASRVTVKPKRIAAIVLAAGRSTRMGISNKLLASLNGKTIIDHVLSNLKNTSIDEIFLVTGHEAEAIKEAVKGHDVTIVHNENYKNGLSTSLRAGIEALPDTLDAALIVLGDMPFIRSEDFERMKDAFRDKDGAQVIVATTHGKRANPVLWSRYFFQELRDLQGDTGARHLIDKHQSVVLEIEMGEGASHDLDTPEALEAVGGYLHDTGQNLS